MEMLRNYKIFEIEITRQVRFAQRDEMGELLGYAKNPVPLSKTEFHIAQRFEIIKEKLDYQSKILNQPYEISSVKEHEINSMTISMQV